MIAPGCALLPGRNYYAGWEICPFHRRIQILAIQDSFRHSNRWLSTKGYSTKILYLFQINDTPAITGTPHCAGQKVLQFGLALTQLQCRFKGMADRFNRGVGQLPLIPAPQP